MEDTVFRENVVIITGASRGIGREVAYQLAAQGAWLSLAARDAERSESAAAKCRERGGRALVVPTDVCEQPQCKNLIEQTVKEYGRIDTLVNNAGITMWARFEDIRDLSLLERIMQTNYMGSVYCTYYALPHVIHTQGRIVGVSSLTGKTGVPTRSGYAASKHAMAGFVTMIYPGFVATGVRERAIGADGKPLEVSPVHESEVMTVETCARLIVQATAQRRRELIMTTRGRVGQWIRLIAPEFVDRMARKAIETGR
jgi:short-subunit dehydrogenase